MLRRQLDIDYPLRVFRAVVAGVEQPNRKAVFCRQRFAIHLIGEERLLLHCISERDSGVIPISAAEDNHFRLGFHAEFLKDIAQADTFPRCVAHLHRANCIADALQRSHRRHSVHRGDGFKRQRGSRFLYQTGDSQSPVGCVNLGRFPDLEDIEIGSRGYQRAGPEKRVFRGLCFQP